MKTKMLLIVALAIISAQATAYNRGIYNNTSGSLSVTLKSNGENVSAVCGTTEITPDGSGYLTLPVPAGGACRYDTNGGEGDGLGMEIQYTGPKPVQYYYYNNYSAQSGSWSYTGGSTNPVGGDYSQYVSVNDPTTGDVTLSLPQPS